MVACLSWLHPEVAMHEGYFSSCAVVAEHGRGATQLRLFSFLWLLLCAPRGRARTKAAKGHARPPGEYRQPSLNPLPRSCAIRSFSPCGGGAFQNPGRGLSVVVLALAL